MCCEEEAAYRGTRNGMETVGGFLVHREAGLRLGEFGVEWRRWTGIFLRMKIAAGTFPPAIATITTEEETVDGKVARKNIPSHW